MILYFLKALASWLRSLSAKDVPFVEPEVVVNPVPDTVAIPVLPVPLPDGSAPIPTEPQPEKYMWDTPAHVRHSVRVICDEEELSVYEKNVITACIQQESQFNNAAICRNKDAQTGHVWSTDWGICQINDYWHIGKGKSFPTVEYVINNPDKVVRFMIAMYRKGQLKQWVSYSSGAYKKYMP